MTQQDRAEESDRKTIAVSGGFDPVHVGHVRMIRAAAEIGDVVVIINSDNWLKRKKGYIFMPWKERAEILESIKGVISVIEASDYDDTVCDTLVDLRDIMRLDFFANGGDRKLDNTPEMNICNQYGIEMLWNVGGGKIQSSSCLVRGTKKDE